MESSDGSQSPHHAERATEGGGGASMNDSAMRRVLSVRNIALAEATAKQKPSLCTWRMAQVYPISCLVSSRLLLSSFVLS